MKTFSPLYFWKDLRKTFTAQKAFHFYLEAANGSVLLEKLFRETSQNSLENICAEPLFLIKSETPPATLLKKEILAQVFSCEFCEISKNTFFKEHL